MTPPAFRSASEGGGTGMAAKILKYAALPAAVVGLGSFRIYSTAENKSEELISPKELSIYSLDRPAVRFVDERSGVVQTGLGAVRVGLQPYVRTVQNALTSVKLGVLSAYQAGEDTYYFLRDPPPGFLPRVGVITVSGLGGLILARKGSRLKRIVFPIGLALLGTAVCYPTQTVGVLKITGKKVYNVSSSVASMFQSKPKAEVIMPSAAPVTISDPVSLTPEQSELAPVVSSVPKEVTSSSEVEPEITPESVEKAAETVSEPPVPEPVDVSETTPADFDVSKPASTETIPESDASSVDVSEIVLEADPANPELEGLAPLEEATPSSPPPSSQATAEEVPPPASEATPTPLIVEVSGLQTESSESPGEQVAVEAAAVKSRFVPDPALLDHGQANPEDADMYSTRS